MTTPPAPRGSTALHSLRPREAAHERASHGAIARRLAGLVGRPYVGDFRIDAAVAPCYLVPSDTLVGQAQRDALAIRSQADFFGGWVPHPFTGTKSITHGLIQADAAAPEGWNPAFAEAVRDSVLPGYTAFSTQDAREAGRLLLAAGPVRIKPVRATAGRGQSIAQDLVELDAALGHLDERELALCGVVLEVNLTEVRTYSVGQVRVGGLLASYYGTQSLTPDNTGELVYGGSVLTVARGDFDALLSLPLPAAAHLAVAQAARYDTAADQCFPALIASRRNYDTVVGLDAKQRPRSGVLEQSWRIGGASGAEVLALEALAADPSCQQVRAATVERYGTAATPPRDAQILFHGEDDEVGALLKYAILDPERPASRQTITQPGNAA